MKRRIIQAKVVVIIITMLLTLTLSACSNETTATVLPTWLVEHWDIEETEYEGIYFANSPFGNVNISPRDNPSLFEFAFFLEPNEFEGIPVIRTYWRQDYYNRKEIPHLFPAPPITQEVAIRSALDYISNTYEEVNPADETMFIMINLHDMGWDIQVQQQEEDGHIWLIHRIIIDPHTGEVSADLQELVERTRERRQAFLEQEQ